MSFRVQEYKDYTRKPVAYAIRYWSRVDEREYDVAYCNDAQTAVHIAKLLLAEARSAARLRRELTREELGEMGE